MISFGTLIVHTFAGMLADTDKDVSGSDKDDDLGVQSKIFFLCFIIFKLIIWYTINSCFINSHRSLITVALV